MSAGRTYWLALDARWLARENVVEAREEGGHAAVTVLLVLMGQAKLENDGGTLTTGYRTLAREAFLDGGQDEARALVTLCHASSLLDDFEEHEDGKRFSCRISGWVADQTKGRAADRKAAERAAESSASIVDSDPGPDVTESDESRLVTHRHVPVGTGQDSTGEERTEQQPCPAEAEPVGALPSPAKIDEARGRLQAGQVQQVFDAWVAGREAQHGIRSSSALDGKRRKLIRSALASHGLEDVLAAVVGWRRSPHHRGENDRRTVYDDLELLLRDAAHIERFRDFERGANLSRLSDEPDMVPAVDGGPSIDPGTLKRAKRQLEADGDYLEPQLAEVLRRAGVPFDEARYGRTPA